MAVEPSLMASSEYSTWKRRPSGEKVLGESQSYVYNNAERERNGIVNSNVLDTPVCVATVSLLVT
jgi:hypothetical protein